ncbi:DNA-binding transcriptional MerR regulator [Isoptericola sp. CG 20/1183]|uniref:DNA-binding transcriptional MerR regulator n=1 Tax=Isoptericola halotolerans TaxID=300560 RepID=A0ABX5EHY6_9MICO|nr:MULTISPECIES: MerR family transcriptional regulator [Isoptericola]PRZ04084.1 DNA-binding transcriptional MerR regulator [Isoptericola sp. CG 20/1183]PRZ10091.1 DNA-binding transcriptional MerR regulator [Isoptericola halotolerans]
MRSSELARLAGVSVRTLRHYHRVGVLDEPARGGNGYRRYDVHDLVRVLRIRRLAALGIPLAQVPALLERTETDGPAADSDQLLDELDRELAGQMARLARQREVIAQLRDHHAAPDLPPELAPFFRASPSVGVLARIDRDQTVLLAHLAGEEGMPHLARLYERLSDALLAARGSDLSERFDRLGPDSSDAEVTALVDAFLEVYGPVVDELASARVPLDLGGTEDYFTEFTDTLLNEQQLRAFKLLEARLVERSTRDEVAVEPPPQTRSRGMRRSQFWE